MPKKPTVIKRVDPNKCIACSGSGKASNGFRCHPCNGSGLKKPKEKPLQ